MTVTRILLALNRIIEQSQMAQATTPEGQAHRCLHAIEETARKAFGSISQKTISLCSCRCHQAESCNCGCCGMCPR